MEDRVTSHVTKRVAVVTGANKGLGLEISRQLASNGVMVVLTARDVNRGLESVKNLKASGLSNIIFHQLDVMDPASIASFADFIKTQFGKLDILVNNAGVTGAITDWEKVRGVELGDDSLVGENGKLWKVFIEQPFEKAEACLATNYYGVKRVTEAVIPLLQSNSAKIVNVSSTMGQLKMISNERAKKELSDVAGLTEEKVEEVLRGFLEDVKEGLVESKGWPTKFSAYTVSKAALNAYTRVLAKKYPHIAINAVCPGYVKTDINDNTGVFTVEEGAKGPVMLALMPEGGASGLFFQQMEISNF